MEPSFEEPWSDGQVLTPAPEQPVQPEPGSMYVPPPPVGLIDGDWASADKSELPRAATQPRMGFR